MPKNYSIGDAQKILGITAFEANRLDAADGKADGKIKKDIFTAAKEALGNAKPVSYEQVCENPELMNFSSLSNAEKSVAASLAKKMGLEGYILSDDPEYKAFKKDKDGEPVLNEDVGTMAEMTSDIVEHMSENDTTNPKGIAYEGLPNGVENVKLQTELLYTDGENDTVTFDENGNGTVQKNPDDAVTRTNFLLNGHNYEIGLFWNDVE